ncbi:MAG: hypothetical protein AAF799_09195 [Myxococcota bacterium]
MNDWSTRRTVIGGAIIAIILWSACRNADGQQDSSPRSTAASPAAGRDPSPSLANPEAPRFVEAELPRTTAVATGFAGAGLYVLLGSPGSLALVRTDGEFAPISLLMPSSNHNNRWRFQNPGERLEASDSRLDTLIRVPHEGFYRTTRELLFGTDGLWTAGAIVQLGYDVEGAPLIFIAQYRMHSDSLFFSDKGIRITREQLKWLEPLNWYEHPEDPAE